MGKLMKDFGNRSVYGVKEKPSFLNTWAFMSYTFTGKSLPLETFSTLMCFGATYSSPFGDRAKVKK